MNSAGSDEYVDRLNYSKNYSKSAAIEADCK